MVSRARRIKGQVEAIERALEGDGESEDLLQLVASCRGMSAGVKIDHIAPRKRRDVAE